MIRKYITHYYRDKYILEKIYDGLRGKFAIDESLFTYINEAQFFVIGAIETTTKNFHIDIIKERNSNNIEKFIKKFVSFNSSIITDGWSGYSWLDRANFYYYHIVHSHSTGDFG